MFGGRTLAGLGRRRLSFRWAAPIALLGLLAPPAQRSASAQFLDAALPRRGEFRAGVSTSQAIFERTHVPGGAREPLGAPYSAALDARFFPELASLDTAVANLLAAAGGAPPTRPLSLGSASLDLQAEVTELELELVLGVTSWLAVGGELPIVRARMFASPRLDERTAGAGQAGSAFGGNPTAFFDGVDTSLAALDSLIASGTLDPAARTQAEALRDRTRTYADGLEDYAADLGLPKSADGLDSLQSRFTLLPTDSGEAGRNLRAVHDELAAGFSSFGITFPALDLADALARDAAFGLLADSLAMAPFGGAETGYRLGDAAARIWIQPLNTFRPVPVGAPEPWLRYRAAAALGRRFPSGSRDRPDRAYDLPTGRGSAAIEAQATVDLALRRRLWLSVEAAAAFQERDSLIRRVTPPDSPLVGAAREAAVFRDPGTAWTWTVLPRLNVNESVSLGLLFQRESRERDRYEFVGAPLPGISADVLGAGSDFDATRWGIHISYRTTGALGEGRPSRPIEATLSYLKTAWADGRAPATAHWRVAVRGYF